MAKPQFREETIVEVKIEGEAANIILENGDLLEALDPENFPGEEAGMEQVQKLVGDLQQTERDLLLRALQSAIIEPSHDARAVFGTQATDYEIEGTGLEIKDDAMDERERSGPLRVSPVAVVFIQSA